jgi:glycerophosphoryl diester phosphodiesterase
MFHSAVGGQCHGEGVLTATGTNQQYAHPGSLRGTAGRTTSHGGSGVDRFSLPGKAVSLNLLYAYPQKLLSVTLRVWKEWLVTAGSIGACGRAAVVAAVLAVGVPFGSVAGADNSDSDPAAESATPIVIGHRGASGYRPEHTLAAYRLAIRQGADVIEPDLVPTRDGVLVARHENEISGTTDVADHPEFADRRTTKAIDGGQVTGWFTEDFTLAELKTLKARERLPELRPANTRFDGEFEIPTLQEIIDLARKASRWADRAIAIYPETKHPTYFRDIGLPLEPAVAQILRANELDGPDSPVLLQSFEPSSLRELNGLVAAPLFLNLNDRGRPYDFVVSGDPRTYADLATPEGLRWIAGWGDGVSLNKNLIVPRDPSGRLSQPTSVVADAHAAGLTVHSWTFRSENVFLPVDFRSGTDPAAWGDAAAEYSLFFGLGVDGMFSDFPDVAVAARNEFTGTRAA